MPEDIGPDELPIPFGIQAETGIPIPGLTDTDLQNIAPDRAEVIQRSHQGVAEHFAIADVDPENLAEAGWCVVFPENGNPLIEEALEPLLNVRKQEAGRLFKVFSGPAGIRAGEDARQWIERQGAGFAVVDPEVGVPLYILLVGSPQEISFEFQYLLDVYWNVGRLHFDTVEEYRRYAENIVAYETGPVAPREKRAVIFSVRNDGDRATALLHAQVTKPLLDGAPGMRALQGVGGFKIEPIFADDATKARLSSVLNGTEPGGVPSLLFTGSHGVKFRIDDPMQREKQGAILCQDWPGFGAVMPEHLFTAADVPAHASLQGLIHFFFACYGGGCPEKDNFGRIPGAAPTQLVPQAIVARLPQRMLNAGALASFAHVDRAWAYSFQNGRGSPLVNDFRDVMVRILKGQRLGQALDGFNLRWAVLSAEMLEAQTKFQEDNQPINKALLANRLVARNDARNYLVIGDPAVRFRRDSFLPTV